MQVIEKIEGLHIGHGTHEGMSGKHNEDSYGFFAWDNGAGKPLFIGVVADGVGGQTAGEVASSLAVEAVRNYFRAQNQINGNISGHLERAIWAANKEVYQYSQGHSEVSGMGTTMVLVAIFENKLYTAYVGDSRIYLYRDGALQQVTVDHTWAQEAIQVGLLTREQAKTHPNRNVIKRFLGGFPEVEVDHRLVTDPDEIGDEAKVNQGLLLQAGDTVLLCSDGLSDMIDDRSIQTSLEAYNSQLQVGVQDMINKANQAGGRDNITALVLRIPDKNKPAPLTTARMPRLAATTTATGMTIPTATTPASPPALPQVEPRSRAPLFLVIGGLFILIPIAILAVVFGLQLLNRSATDSTPSPSTPLTIGTTAPGATGSESQSTQGAATLSVIEVTNQVQTTPTVGSSTTYTVTNPALIPTLIPTNTNTPTRVPPTATPTPTSAATATPTSTLPPPPPPDEPPPTATTSPPIDDRD